MNVTSVVSFAAMTLNNNLTLTLIESRFIPFDLLVIVCTVFATILAIFFLSIIILDKTCHTVPVILVANSYLAEFLFGIIMIWMAGFALHNDLNKVQYQDSLCDFRGYLGYVLASLQKFSYLLRAIYRYITVIYPHRFVWQSARFQAFLICLTRIIAFVCAVPCILNDEIKYDMDNEMCQLPFRLSFLQIYTISYVYMLRTTLIMLIYFKVVRYVREMGKHVTPVNTLLRAQRGLKMVRRIVILVAGVCTIGFPYTLFVLMSFFTSPPKYHFRIAFTIMNVS
jgi:hypothetical protein